MGTKITAGTLSFRGASGIDLVKEPLRRQYIAFLVVKLDMLISGVLVVRFILPNFVGEKDMNLWLFSFASGQGRRNELEILSDCVLRVAS